METSKKIFPITTGGPTTRAERSPNTKKMPMVKHYKLINGVEKPFFTKKDLKQQVRGLEDKLSVAAKKQGETDKRNGELAGQVAWYKTKLEETKDKEEESNDFIKDQLVIERERNEKRERCLEEKMEKYIEISDFRTSFSTYQKFKISFQLKITRTCFRTYQKLFF